MRHEILTLCKEKGGVEAAGDAGRWPVVLGTKDETVERDVADDRTADGEPAAPSPPAGGRLARAFSFPLILLPLSGIGASGALIAIALGLRTEPQSYETFTCGPHASPDCLGWSFVTTGPFYLFYVLFYGLLMSLAVLIALAPAVLAIHAWISRASATKLDRPRLTIVRLFKILYSDEPGPAA